jgi:hypothetical protein
MSEVESSNTEDSSEDIELLANLVIYTPDEILWEGLQVAGFDRSRLRMAGIITNIARFKAFYGASPSDVAIVWEELQTTDVEEALLSNEDKDIHFLLMALHFLFVYPTKHRAEGLFGVAVKTFYKWTWKFIDKLAALSRVKVVWPEEWSENSGVRLPKFLVSVDGVHCRNFESEHPTLPKNRKVRICYFIYLLNYLFYLLLTYIYRRSASNSIKVG